MPARRGARKSLSPKSETSFLVLPTLGRDELRQVVNQERELICGNARVPPDPHEIKTPKVLGSSDRYLLEAFVRHPVHR